MADQTVVTQTNQGQYSQWAPRPVPGEYSVSAHVRNEVSTTLRTLVTETGIDSALVLRLARELSEARAQNQALRAALPPKDAPTQVPPEVAQLQREHERALEANIHLQNIFMDLRARYAQISKRLWTLQKNVATPEAPASPMEQRIQSPDVQKQIESLKRELAESRNAENNAIHYCEMLRMQNMSLQDQLSECTSCHSPTPSVPAKRPQQLPLRVASQPYSHVYNGSPDQLRFLPRAQLPPRVPAGNPPAFSAGEGTIGVAANEPRVVSASQQLSLQQYQQYQYQQHLHAQQQAHAQRPPQQPQQQQPQQQHPQQQHPQQQHPQQQPQPHVQSQPHPQPYGHPQPQHQTQTVAPAPTPQRQASQHYSHQFHSLAQTYAQRPQDSQQSSPQPWQQREQPMTSQPSQQQSRQHQQVMSDSQQQLLQYQMQHPLTRPISRQFYYPPPPRSLHVDTTERAAVSNTGQYRTPPPIVSPISSASWSGSPAPRQSDSGLSSPSSALPAFYRFPATPSPNEATLRQASTATQESPPLQDGVKQEELAREATEDVVDLTVEERTRKAMEDIIDLTLDDPSDSPEPESGPPKKRQRTEEPETLQLGQARPQVGGIPEGAMLEWTAETQAPKLSLHEDAQLPNVNYQPQAMDAQPPYMDDQTQYINAQTQDIDSQPPREDMDIKQCDADAHQQDAVIQSQNMEVSPEQQVEIPKLIAQQPSSAEEQLDTGAQTMWQQPVVPEPPSEAESVNIITELDPLKELPQTSADTSTIISLDHPEIVEFLEYSFYDAEDNPSQKSCTFCRMRHDDDPESWPSLTTFSNPNRDEVVGHLQEVHAEVWDAVLRGLNEEPEEV